MGAGNVKAAYALWSSLEDLPHRVLCYMAVVSHDGPSPRYWGGREALALAAGRPVPDPARGNPAVAQARRAAFKVVDRALAALAAAGAIVQTGTAHPGRNAEYRLNMVGQAALFDGRALADPLDMEGRCGHPKASGGPCIAWPRKGSRRCVAHQEWTPVSGPYGPRSVDPMDPGEWTNGPRSVDIMHPAHRGPEEEQEQAGTDRNAGQDEYLDLNTDVQVARATRCTHGFPIARRPDGTHSCALCRRGDPCPDPADPDTHPAAPPPTDDPTDASAEANASPTPNHPPPPTTGHHRSVASPPPLDQDPTSSPADPVSPPPPPANPTPAAGNRKDAT